MRLRRKGADVANRYHHPNERVTEDFRWGELCVSETADEHGIEIRVERDGEVSHNLRALVQRVLQPFRDALGEPLYLTSVYRPPEVNRLVGGVEDSDHVLGRAADAHAEDVAGIDLAHVALDAGIVFDQLILEHDQGGIVHVSYRRGEPNRGEVLTRFRDGGLVYHDGLLAEGDL